MKLDSIVGNNKKSFFRYVNGKRRNRANIYLMRMILEEDSHLTIKDIDKAEMFNAFFTSVFNTDNGPWNSQMP